MIRTYLIEEQIQQMIVSDFDSLKATNDQIAQAKLFHETFPSLAARMRIAADDCPKSFA
ncbi:MAG: hypothetical protein OXC62_08895 [Aestuariivita sp.]|nr:hypothetical protein [Aestuariivita sp.]